jgi:hypothetical protein
MYNKHMRYNQTPASEVLVAANQPKDRQTTDSSSNQKVPTTYYSTFWLTRKGKGKTIADIVITRIILPMTISTNMYLLQSNHAGNS